MSVWGHGSTIEINKLLVMMIRKAMRSVLHRQTLSMKQLEEAANWMYWIANAYQTLDTFRRPLLHLQTYKHMYIYM